MWTFPYYSHSDIALRVLGILHTVTTCTLYISLDDVTAIDIHGVHLGVQVEGDSRGAIVCNNSSFNSW